jgi:HEAT repeat protein
MKHPARWLIALALLACGLAWWWNMPPPEPVYQGQPLSRWMRNDYEQESSKMVAACHELRTLVGPPVVTWLAYTAEHGRSVHDKPGIFRILLAQIGWQSVASELPAEYDERVLAMRMLEEMGDMAKPAIPNLVRILNSTSYDHARAAAFTLNIMGSDSWPVVEDQLAHGSNLARCELLNTLWLRFDPERDGHSEADILIISLLGQALHDKEPNIRRNAAVSLDKMVGLVKVPGPLMDQVALALWALPRESNKEVREARKGVLSYYRETRAEALPRLTALLTDPDDAKRNFARDILKEIEPASTKAEAP